MRKSCNNSANYSRRTFLTLLNAKVGKCYLKRLISLGFYADNSLIMERRNAYHVKIYCCRDHAAVLVVSMIAAYLRPSGSRVNVYVTALGIGL